MIERWLFTLGLVAMALPAAAAAAPSCDTECDKQCQTPVAGQSPAKCKAVCEISKILLCAIGDTGTVASAEKPSLPTAGYDPHPNAYHYKRTRPPVAPAPSPSPSLPTPPPGSAPGEWTSVHGGDPAALSEPPIATRLFTDARFDIPEDFGAIAVLVFPNEAAQDPQRQRQVCRAFVSVLDESGDVAKVDPNRKQMVTIWPVTRIRPALRFDIAAHHDAEAVARVCPTAIADYDYFQASGWVDKMPAAARLGAGRGPFLIAWAPPRQYRDPHVPILTYDLSAMDTPNSLIEAFGIWKDDIEQNPQLWSQGWSKTRFRLTMAAIADKFGGQIAEAMKLVPWLGSDK